MQGTQSNSEEGKLNVWKWWWQKSQWPQINFSWLSKKITQEVWDGVCEYSKVCIIISVFLNFYSGKYLVVCTSLRYIQNMTTSYYLS